MMKPSMDWGCALWFPSKGHLKGMGMNVKPHVYGGGMLSFTHQEKPEWKG